MVIFATYVTRFLIFPSSKHGRFPKKKFSLIKFKKLKDFAHKTLWRILKTQLDYGKSEKKENEKPNPILPWLSSASVFFIIKLYISNNLSEF